MSEDEIARLIAEEGSDNNGEWNYSETAVAILQQYGQDRLEAAAKLAEAESELPGEMPELARLALELDPERFVRGAVRVTKQNIAASIRALMSK